MTERKMFGGLAFMVRGHMACGIVGDDLMLRLGVESAEQALDRPPVRRMDFTGRPMTGMVYVGPNRTSRAPPCADGWAKSVAFVESLPPKD